jgi:hypothetical protein
MKANPQKVQALLINTAAQDAVPVFPSAAKSGVALRPIFNLQQHPEPMGVGADANTSRVSKSFRSIHIFLNAGSAYTTNAKLSSFIDSTYLKRVADDAALSKMAHAP